MQKRLQAIEKHKRHVNGGNDLLAWQRDMGAQAEAARIERRRRYLLDQNPIGTLDRIVLLGANTDWLAILLRFLCVAIAGVVYISTATYLS